MPKITLEDISLLFNKVVLPFYQLERDMPLPVKNHRNENDAEHSWSLTLLACALAPEIDPALDVGKIAIFATVHDVVEIKAGDTSLWADQSLHDTKAGREKDALASFTRQFPQFPSLFNYIHQYEQKDTDEALFVYALDKLVNLLIVYEAKGYYYKNKYKITHNAARERLETHRSKAHSHPKIAAYYEELRRVLDDHPEYFYQK